MTDYHNLMRRNWRMILKWFIILGICSIVFKLICDSFVNIYLSIPNSWIKDGKGSNSDVAYEDFLTSWANTGQRLKNEKLSMKNIKTRNDLQLIGAQIFFRHGARTPLHLLPSLEEVFYKMRKMLIYIIFLHRLFILKSK